MKFGYRQSIITIFSNHNAIKLKHNSKTLKMSLSIHRKIKTFSFKELLSERKFKMDMQSIEKILIMKKVPVRICVIEPKTILKGKCIALNISIKDKLISI